MKTLITATMVIVCFLILKNSIYNLLILNPKRSKILFFIGYLITIALSLYSYEGLITIGVVVTAYYAYKIIKHRMKKTSSRAEMENEQHIKYLYHKWYGIYITLYLIIITFIVYEKFISIKGV